MEHQKIFPTNLFLIEEFYHSDTSVMKKYIFDLWESRDYDNRWQTKSANLHKQKEFKEFTELVISTSKEILDKSNLRILSASDLNDAAKKIVEAIK